MSRWSLLSGARVSIVTAVVVGLLLGVLGGAAAGYFSRSGEVDRLGDRVSLLEDDLGLALDERASATERAVALTEEIGKLQRDLDANEVELVQLRAQVNDLSVTNAEALQLRADFEALQQTNEGLKVQIDGLEGELASVRAQRDNAIADLGSLQTINSLNISPDPLRFNPASPTDVIRALCTGSMEPTIGCNDSLLVYKPARQDLDVGDIIVFWQPTSDCSSVTVGAGILHRIVQIIRSSNGELSFRTQGDALANRDPCPVPFSAVVSKVAAIIFDASLDEN